MRKMWRLIIFALLCISLAVAAAQAADEAPTVRIGYYNDGDYMYRDKDGQYRGYNVEYLYEVAKYNGWHYEFIDFPSWKACYDAVCSGQIDMMPALYWSREREEKLLFSKRKMGDIYITLTVRNDDNRYSYNDPKSFQGMKVGEMTGTLDGLRFREWCEQNNVHVDMVDIDSAEELLQALDSGKIDGAAISFLGSQYKYKVVAEFSPMAMYFVMPRDRSVLMEQMDKGMEQLAIDNPEFSSYMYQKYLSNGYGQIASFSQQELAFINRSGPIRVTILSDNAPFSYIDKQGVMQGALVDYFQELARMSGLTFEFVPKATKKEAIESVEKGEADAVAKIDNDAFFAARHHLYMTNSYFTMITAQVTLKGTSPIQTIAVPEGDLVTVTSNLSEDKGAVPIQHRQYPSVVACFEALDRGEVDALYCDMPTAQYLMQFRRASDYTISALSAGSYEVSIGLREQGNKQLYAILNKCIRYTNANMIDEFVVRHSLSEGSSFLTMFRRIPASDMVVVLVVLMILLILLVAAIIVLVRNFRAERRRVLEKVHDQKLKMALLTEKKAQEARSSFLSSISHDMRTPLNGIIGFTNLAMESHTIGQMKEYLSKIKISGALLLDLINDTLDISKMDRGKLVLMPEPTDITALIRHIIVPIQSNAAARQVVFQADTERGPKGYVYIDRINTQKIFINLLSNAVKFTPAGGTVTLIVEQLEPPQEHGNCRIIVRDTGIGMRPEFLPHLYEPFSQEEGGRRSNQTGTGLGMAIVKSLVDLMKGTIEVHSVLGKGTEFRICLNFLPAQSPIEKERPCQGQDIDKSELQGKRVLLCEDNELNLEIAKTLLEQQQMHVSCAADGKQGVDFFAASDVGSFDVILMDLRMPILDGCSAAKLIRAMDRSDAKTIPILAMTADTSAEDIQRCREAGMNGHIAKPIDRELLYEALAKAL